MDKQKLKKILQDTSPPEVELPENKAALRRQLLNSTTSKWSSLLGWGRQFRYAFGTMVTTLVLAAIVLFYLTPQEISALSLLETVEKSYQEGFSIDKVYHSRVSITNPHSLMPSIIEERWYHSPSQQYRLQMTSIERGKLVSHIILRGDSTFYATDTPVMIDIDIEEATTSNENSGSDSIEHELDEAYTVLILPGSETSSEITAIFVRNPLDYNQLSRRSPLELLDKLKSDSVFVYEGTEVSPNGHETAVLLRREAARGFLIKLAHSESAMAKIHAVLSSLEKNASEEFGEETLQGLVGSADIEFEPLTSIERVRIDAQTHRFYNVEQTLTTDSEVVQSKTITFLDEQFLVYEPDLFDPRLHQLSFREKEHYQYEQQDKN